jgi:ABC-type proline/glycine betaine transport system ATPase subunit
LNDLVQCRTHIFAAPCIEPRKDGGVEQAGTPQNILKKPANNHVRTFIATMK